MLHVLFLIFHSILKRLNETCLISQNKNRNLITEMWNTETVSTFVNLNLASCGQFFGDLVQGKVHFLEAKSRSINFTFSCLNWICEIRQSLYSVCIQNQFTLWTINSK